MPFRLAVRIVTVPLAAGMPDEVFSAGHTSQYRALSVHIVWIYIRRRSNISNHSGKCIPGDVEHFRRSLKSGNVNADRLLNLVKKYTDIHELTAEIIREFVERIYVHQTERIDGKRVQRIRIVWNCIGELTPPTPEQVEKTA